MSLPVEIRTVAADDIQYARLYMNDQQLGRGDRFVIEVQNLLVRIGEMPEMYGIVGRGVRAAGIKRFGYIIYYRANTQRVEVIAVIHGARSSKIWKKRLE